MIGNRVRVILDGTPQTTIDGVLHKMAPEGVTIWPLHQLPEASGNRFFPMRRVIEIIDLGRMP